ncbi:restriction endonuclease subunit S [Robertmurraya massiliosenegalensis]|uniref:restriction endonuclease subunit S n=1 Tax=Robertmurraya massiliosenegalensis TaxID=1287657 RepID=UPI000318E862|nr:restriction endonuclease subunit S [Robertmurraya massiliosenegalensis]
MIKYRLGDIVDVISDREDNPSNCKYDKFVGLEHYISGEVEIKNYGNTDLLKSAMKVFRAGDILIARRNVYLRRASIVNFDGITSGDSIVLRAEDRLIKKLLPFVLNTDTFWEFAEKFSDGTMSKRLSPKVLLEYKFNLPDIKEQEKLAELLWAANETKQAYKKLLSLTNDLVKSRFIEMFGNPVANQMGWPVAPLGKVSNTRLGKMLDAKKQTGECQYPYLANFNVQWFHFDLSNLKKMDFIEKDRVEFSLQKGDLLVCEGGEVGRTAIWNEEIEDCYFQKALHRVRCNPEILVPEYLAYVFFMRASLNGFEDIVGKSTIPHLTGEKLKKLLVILPPLDLQNQFAAFVQQIDKSKYELQQTISNLENTVKSLMKQYVG